MTRKLAVSDVHGHGTLLQSLLEFAGYVPGRDQLILLGDYVNKGPDSSGSIQIVRQLIGDGAIALRGNHEQRLIGTHCAGAVADERPFLQSLPLYYEDDAYVYVHAGIRPGLALENQLADDLTSIREGFLDRATRHHKRVIFGHTPTHRLGAPAGTIWIRKDKIGIDTWAACGGCLSLVDLTMGKVYSSPVDAPSVMKTYDIKL